MAGGSQHRTARTDVGQVGTTRWHLYLRILGVDAVRYSFIVMDLHHLLLAGLPSHSGLPR